ncbi:MAG: thioredoxin family protein [Sarcina sp.]
MERILEIKDIISNSKTYKEIRDTATQEESEMIEIQAQKFTSIEYRIEELKGINTTKRIAVFIANRCGDAATMIPFLNAIALLNPNISLSFFEGKAYEEFLQKVTGDFRVPTILFLNSDYNINEIYLEFPRKVRALIEENQEMRTEIVKNFRNKEFNLDIQKDIIDAIIKIK